MKEVYLKVTKSLPDDFGRGIARIDTPAFPELKLSQGDVIEITASARPWRWRWVRGRRQQRTRSYRRFYQAER